MRLLEFNKDDGGANPQRSTGPAAPSRPAAASTPARRRRMGGLKPPGAGKVFPVAGNTLIKSARHSPVDLEQLQSRIDFLENHLQSQATRLDEHATTQELKALQQRLQRLENDLDSELWASRQREHTMLELLSRPPLKVVIKNRLNQLWVSDLPAAGRWAWRILQLWWLDSQPEWWPRLARAWQESLDKARR